MEKFTRDGVEYDLPTAAGLMFQSQAVAYQLIVRPRRPIYDSGVLIGEERELVAEFGDMDAPAIHDPDTGENYYAIRGHFIQTLEQGRKKEWSDEERALVEKKLLASQQPGLHWLYSAPPAEKPWPTYDQMEWRKIPPAAAQLGLAQEALAYERENENREAVVEALETALAEQPERKPIEQEVVEEVAV